MNRIRHILLLFLMILLLSCFSCGTKLPEYQNDEFDESMNHIQTDSENYYNIESVYISDELKLRNKEDRMYNSDSNSYFLIFREENIKLKISYRENLCIYCSAKEENDNNYFIYDGSFTSKKYGYNRFKSFLSRFLDFASCGHFQKKGAPRMSIYTMSLKFISIPYHYNGVDETIRLEYYENKNYKDSPLTGNAFRLRYRFIVNVFIGDTLIGKLGYDTYNNKPMNEAVEELFSDTNLVSIEDLLAGSTG